MTHSLSLGLSLSWPSRVFPAEAHEIDQLRIANDQLRIMSEMKGSQNFCKDKKWEKLDYKLGGNLSVYVQCSQGGAGEVTASHGSSSGGGGGGGEWLVAWRGLHFLV